MQAGTEVTRARGGHGDGEHRLDYVYILTVETVRFLKDQIWYRREKVKDNTRLLAETTRRMQLLFTNMRRVWRRAGVGAILDRVVCRTIFCRHLSRNN